MNFKTNKLPKSQLEIEIEISPEELENFIEQATLKLGSNLEVGGFRKGMAPKEIVKEKIGKENILVEAADLAIKENYRKTILENKIEAISQPEIDILKLAEGNPFIFKARISVLPELKLPDYKKIASRVRKNKISVEEKEVEDALEWFRKSRAKFTLKNDSAQKGDFIEIEYQIFHNAVSNQPLQKDSFVLGEGHFIPGFEDVLIGMKAGEEKEKISLTIPENHRLKDLAGKEIEIKVKIISVQNVEFPDLDEQFAKNLGNFSCLDDLKKNIKEGINTEKEQVESQRVRNEILEGIKKEIKIEIPQILVEQEQNRILEEFRQNVSENLKIPFSDYLNQVGKSEKELKDSFSGEAENRVKNFLILRELGKIEKIEVSEQEITDEMNKILKYYHNAEKAEKELDSEKLKLYTENAIKNEKILKLLESFAE